MNEKVIVCLEMISAPSRLMRRTSCWYTPAYPQMKLWYDTLRKLERSVEDNMQQIGRERMKYGIVDPEKFQPEPRPLSKIFVISSHNKSEFIRTEVKGMEKIRVLRNQFYGQRFFEGRV